MDNKLANRLIALMSVVSIFKFNTYVKFFPCLPFTLLLLFTPILHAEEVYILAVDDWDRPHDVKSVATLKPLPDVVASWSALSQKNDDVYARIDIRYPGGELGQLLAKRLSDWLVVLGIPSNLISLTPGSAAVTQLELLIQ